MIRPSKLRSASAFACVSLWATATAVLCTPSGLNNIPTADVTPTDLLVLQEINNFGSNQQSRFTAGFKWGVSENIEVGYDGRIKDTSAAGKGMGVIGAGGAPGASATFNVKLRHELTGTPVALGFGLANLSFSKAKAGEEVSYVVASRKFETVNGHLGYLFVNGGRDNLFVGVDGQASPELTWRVDFNNLNNTDNLLSSVGFIYQLNDTWLLEGWYSMSETAATEDTLTLKLDYVIPLQ